MDFSQMSVDDTLALMLAHGYAGLQKAAELREQQRQTYANMQALIPQAVDALIDGEFISKEARAEATKKFSDPANCLKLLKKFAEVSIPKDRVHAYEFGAPVKQAAANTVPYGADFSHEMKASDRVWFEGDF